MFFGACWRLAKEYFLFQLLEFLGRLAEFPKNGTIDADKVITRMNKHGKKSLKCFDTVRQFS